MDTKLRDEFIVWFNTQNFRNFKAAEFTHYFARPLNDVPPKALWKNIVPTLRLVDDLRDHVKSPIVILSSYRSVAYNKKVGGEKKSYHMSFRALDIAAAEVSPRKLRQLLVKWRDAGKFSGGIGLYPTFVHVDTRGYNADW